MNDYARTIEQLNGLIYNVETVAGDATDEDVAAMIEAAGDLLEKAKVLCEARA